jgi:outer membrane biosynthesis protein TonB
MKKYVFLAKCPTKIEIAGQILRFQTGELYIAYDPIAKDILEGNLPGTEHMVMVTAEEIEEPTKAEPPAVDASPEPPKVEPEPTPAPIHVEEPAPTTATTDPEEETMKPLPPEIVEQLSHLPEVPLPNDAHWSTVKAFLLGMEAEGDINLEMVKAVALKYQSYSAVKKEAERILREHEAPEGAAAA